MYALKITFVLLILFPLLILSGNAEASYTHNYGTISGASIDFLNVTETTDTENGAVYGNPQVFGGTNLLFFTNTFSSTSSNGNSDTTDGRLTMTLQAEDGKAIRRVNVTEYGSYSISGNSAKANAIVSLAFDNDPLSEIFNQTFTTVGNNDFTVTTSYDFSGTGTRSLDFELYNWLHTESDATSTANIDILFSNTSVTLEVDTTPVPVPAAVWMLGSALGPVCWMRRRSRMRK